MKITLPKIQSDDMNTQLKVGRLVELMNNEEWSKALRQLIVVGDYIASQELFQENKKV